MIREELVKIYGEKNTKLILKELRGHTAEILSSGEIDYYDYDVAKAVYRLKDKGVEI